MKKLNKFLLMLVISLGFLITTSNAQIAEKHKLALRGASTGLALVGANSNNTTAGPGFGGSVAYGLGNGFTVFAESGYGFTNINSGNDLELRQVPIVGGLTYNFGYLLSSRIIQPYAGVAAGAYVLRLNQNGNSVFASGFEQNSTHFGLKGILGVNFQLSPVWSIDLQGSYSHMFSKSGDTGIDTDEYNSVGFGGGVSYAFSL